MKWNLFFWRSDKEEIKTLRKSAKGGAISAAYKRRAKEIESLRQYDRGEKDIITPNINRLVRDLPITR